MVMVSASDRDMTDVELQRIGAIVRSWPVFEDFDDEKLIATARACQELLHEPEGLSGALASLRVAIPSRLFDTAYALAFELASVDLEMRMEERRVLALLQQVLGLDPKLVWAIEHATKARHRTLT